MKKSLLLIAMAGGLLTACAPADTPKVAEKAPTPAPEQLEPAGPAPFEFIVYSTGVRNLRALVHVRTGCVWIASPQSGYVDGYGATFKLEEPDGKGGMRQVCDPSIRPATPK
ncbi:hypothetical protein KIKIMORA_01510 [Brevundimonas phage vB_BpoS-Kikimora]|uniref:Lipoprotein n=1 Tax=Brevundimonas phage vB_BpoS-Kikimora TaxID=2948601 RepID=A0A9E7SMS4_9CAUD|nr:hypothetical protein KIKIMORA_01510 [Brevundimonas phage vB_BpoS-Kikimora]